MSKVPPGWNDPPPVPVNHQLPGQASKSRLLNKRVPFNFCNSSSPLPASEVSRLSQLPESNVENITNTDIIGVTEINDGTETIDVVKVIENLTQAAENVQDINKKQDIIKRLEIMKKMWDNYELTAVVQKQIGDFANCIDSNNLKEGNDIYLTLTMNSASICSSWIIAFKYILHHLKE